MTEWIEWMLITADPEIARHAQDCGVHRIFVDMEVNGKQERQGHLDTHKAAHTLQDARRIREVLDVAELMVRVNPLFDGTPGEVNGAADAGADRLMLPMFTNRDEVQTFRGLVPDDIAITFLAETPAALVRTRDWAGGLGEREEIHFGLNDLSLGMGLDFLFEPVAADLLADAARFLQSAGIPFGFGGVARINGLDALPAETVLGEHVRLGSTRAILSRAFHGAAESLGELTSTVDLAGELAKLREAEAYWRGAGPESLAANHELLVERTFEIAAARRARA